MYLWDLQTREIVQVLEGHGGKFEVSPCIWVSLLILFAIDADVVVAVAVSIA